MKNIKYLAFGLLLAALAVTPALAQTADIASLMAQIRELQARLAALQQQQGGTQFCYNFDANLSVGARGAGVNALQTALGREGFTTVKGEFDENTASAVTGFQQKYASEILTPLGLKYGTGYVGPATRAKLNQLYGCGQPDKPFIISVTPSTVSIGSMLTINGRWLMAGPYGDPPSGAPTIATPMVVLLKNSRGEKGLLPHTASVKTASDSSLSAIIPSTLCRYQYHSQPCPADEVFYITPGIYTLYVNQSDSKVKGMVTVNSNSVILTVTSPTPNSPLLPATS